MCAEFLSHKMKIAVLSALVLAEAIFTLKIFMLHRFFSAASALRLRFSMSTGVKKGGIMLKHHIIQITSGRRLMILQQTTIAPDYDTATFTP
jgi:hypothetical protein